jgi:hypothetical protein
VIIYCFICFKLWTMWHVDLLPIKNTNKLEAAVCRLFFLPVIAASSLEQATTHLWGHNTPKGVQSADVN